MRIFFMGAIAALLIAVSCYVLLPDNLGWVSYELTVAAFVCGAVSQAIKQLKE